MAKETTKQAAKQQPSSTMQQQHATEISNTRQGSFPLETINFMLIAGCVLLIVIGFALMTGSANTGSTWNEDIFNARRTVVGPMVALSGFVLMIFAIMYQKKNHQASNINKEEA